MSGDMMPKQQYDFIKGIQDNMLEASNMTEGDAWRFGFLIWQHQEWICKYLIDRKTENNSEKPNNSKEKPNNSKVSEKLTGSTRSKMEQVEPQTCSFSDCDNFKNPNYERCIECKRKQIKLKTEQTERSRR